MRVAKPRGRHGWIVAGAVVALTVDLVVGVLMHGSPCTPVKVPGAFSPQWQRTAEWVGNPASSGFTDSQIDALAASSGLVVIPKSASNFSLSGQFDDARRLVAAGKARGNDIKVLTYYNASYWFGARSSGWGTYADAFEDSWYLKDSTGKPVELEGADGPADSDSTRNYVINLANPAYRQFMVSTIVAWMRAAPFAGVALDSANPLIGADTRGRIGGGQTTWNDLLCGSGAPVDGNGNCSVVASWNQGLEEAVSEVTQALHKSGDLVYYNGISPRPVHGADRNIGMLANANGAVDESFCYTTGSSGSADLLPATSDIDLMRTTAATGKKIIEIVNYRNQSNQKYAEYCLGSFLMGWQPGFQTFIYHVGYGLPNGSLPTPPANSALDLGHPLTTGYTNNNGLLSRSFQRGVVAVNTTEQPQKLALPSTMAVIVDGASTGTVSGSIEVQPHDAAFLLDQNDLGSAAAAVSSKQGCSRS